MQRRPSIISAPIFLMSMRFTSQRSSSSGSPDCRRKCWGGSPPSPVSAAVQYSLIFTGLKGLDASVAAIVVQLEVPFMVVLGVLLLGETAGLRKWISIGGASGVGLIAGEPRVGGAWISLLMVLAILHLGLGPDHVRSAKGVDGLTMTAWISVFAAPQLLLLSFIFETNRGSVLTASPMDWEQSPISGS